MNHENGLAGMAFIALNNPYNRYGAFAIPCTSGWSTARAQTIHDPQIVRSDTSTVMSDNPTTRATTVFPQ
jgi:hypothetical protein